MKTPEDYRRKDIKKLFDKILKKEKVSIRTRSILIQEDSQSDMTNVCFSFDLESDGVKRGYNYIDVKGKGFVDAIFTHCHEELVESYTSLKNLSVVELQVKPIFSMSRKKTGTDARTDVLFMLETKEHGISEFSCRSNSVIRASFQAIMEAFQFYVNCDKAFLKLKSFLDDANRRNRADIAQQILTDMAKLTTVNNYG